MSKKFTPIFHLNPRIFAQLLNQRPPLSQLKQIHAQILTQSLWSHVSLINSLIICHLHAKDLVSARILFSIYPLRSPPTLIWNLMIRAHSKNRNSPEPFSFFRQMIALEHSIRIPPDMYTFTFLITSCAHQVSVLHGEVVHGMVMKSGYESDLFVANSLINLYGVFSKMNNALKVFTKMLQRDVFSWTSLVCGYAKQGDMDRACTVLDEMPVRNEVSWAGIISGFVGTGRYVEALKYFRKLLDSESGDGHELKPNEAVLVSALSACAHLGVLYQGCWIHHYIDRNGVPLTSNIDTALIDMYAKCGFIERAYLIFCKIHKPDAQNFTCMISGLSIHGRGQDALSVFHTMLDQHISPNEVTIIGVLNGCSHSGLVEQGSSIFHNMKRLWGIVPKIEHFGCYIDLLGRAGRLEAALEAIENMPFEPDIVIWRALLSACRTHRDVYLAERISIHIKSFCTNGTGGGEVLLSNAHAYLGTWDKVSQLRSTIRERKHSSDIGCSWIEVNGIAHEFRVAERLHPQIVQVREKLHEILEGARLAGYVPSIGQVTFEVTEQ